MADKFLILTVGLPRSGKTTWARQQAQQYGRTIVNPDSIRLAIHGQRFVQSAEGFVWATARAVVHALFLAGHTTVILDATNVTHKRRNEWLSPHWLTRYKHLDTPLEVCVERARAANDQDIIPVIERMAHQFEPLGLDEAAWLES
jgi:predicted kinase